MLQDFANDGGYVALKWAAEDREDGYTQGCQKPAVLHRTTELMSTMS